jgi:hypothetical protein
MYVPTSRSRRGAVAPSDGGADPVGPQAQPDQDPAGRDDRVNGE